MGNIELINIIDEDFVNYKVPSMTLIFPYCTFKCGAENCQNYDISKEKIINISIEALIKRYINNKITNAIVCQGLEPFDSFNELFKFIYKLRYEHFNTDDVVIYTGYDKDEIVEKTEMLKVFPNIIVKYGRFIPNQEHHFDKLLGVELTSPNQYAEYIK